MMMDAGLSLIAFLASFILYFTFLSLASHIGFESKYSILRLVYSCLSIVDHAPKA